MIDNYHRENESDISKARKLSTYLERMGNTDEMRERARVIFNLKDISVVEALLKLVPRSHEVI